MSDPSSGPERLVCLPALDLPPCPSCGARRVRIFRDALEPLMDNMGCELGLELSAGPLCPRCEPPPGQPSRE